jgi:hypothetical protein
LNELFDADDFGAGIDDLLPRELRDVVVVAVELQGPLERKLRGERVQLGEGRIADEVCEAVAVCGPARMIDQDH